MFNRVTQSLRIILTYGTQRTCSSEYSVCVNVVPVGRPEGSYAVRVSRTLRFALFNALKIFPEADKFIVLEDDLILSPDFYS